MAGGMGQAETNVAARSLYLFVNRGATLELGHFPAPEDVDSRSLYLYYNKGATINAGHFPDGTDVKARDLYLLVNRAEDRTPDDVLARSLYLYEAKVDAELFPWIEKISPNEALPGAQVGVYGDGFGATEATEGATVRLGAYDPNAVGPGMAMGVVSWSSRSAGLYPANSGIPTEPAIVVTIPDAASSGMLSVEETV